MLIDVIGRFRTAASSIPLTLASHEAMRVVAKLRREELCSLAVADIDPSQQLLRIRAETTKNHQERLVPYSPATAELFRAYLQHRRELSRERGPLFLSESRRNRGQPVSIWTWSKVVREIAARAGVRQFTTHPPRLFFCFLPETCLCGENRR